jgi:hypothetical protein
VGTAHIPNPKTQLKLACTVHDKGTAGIVPMSWLKCRNVMIETPLIPGCSYN